ncbi:MAG: amidohydrolase family protein [Pirellulaceae bacterium]
MKNKLSRRHVLLGAAQAAVAGALLPYSPAAPASPPDLVPGKYLIWDAHGHLGPPGDTPSQQIANVLKIADRMGIERVIVFMGHPWSFNPSPQELRRQNDQVLQAVAHAGGRAFGFVYLNPNPHPDSNSNTNPDPNAAGKHTQANLDELNRCVRDGPLVGVKLWVAVRCHEACLDPLVARASELQAPILQHTWRKITGNLPGESTAEDLAVLAARHPDASFIAAHSGGDWETGLRAIRATTNVTAEICGGDPTSGFVEMAVRELGARRVIYGSDFPGRSFASQLAKVLGANVPEEAKRLILAGNLQRMLTPICAAKGITL